MPTFFRFDGIKIDLYFNDHLPPHFHPIYAEHEALISIVMLEVIQGSLPAKKQKRVLNWAKANQTTLMEIWENMRK